MVEAAMSKGRRPLLLLWLALLALIGVIVALQFRGDEDTGSGDAHGHGAGTRSLVPIRMSDVGSIEIATEGQLHRFERDESGNWFYHGAHAALDAKHAHQTDPALAEQMRTAFGALDRARMEREVVYDKDKDLYGVVVPKIIIIIYKPKDNQPVAQYAVGDMAPDGFTRYVHLVGSTRVVTLPQYHIENLLSVIRRAASAVPLVLPAAPEQPGK
jgi:hypothetical protein